MHILPHRYLYGVEALGGIHDILVVEQPRRVALRIVEREVQVVGKIGEDVFQVLT